MQPPLVHLVGYLAHGPAVASILDGTFVPPPELDIHTVEFIEELRRPVSVQRSGSIDMTVSLHDHIRGWRLQKSGTAVDPSSLDFDHYKCATHNDTLSAVDLLLRTAPVEIGFVPQSWCSILDIEILKKYGVFDIDKMRLIQVMHAVFQINNKWLGKKVMEHVELLNKIASG